MKLEQAVMWLERLAPGTRVLTYTAPLAGSWNAVLLYHVVERRQRLMANNVTVLVMQVRMVVGDGEPGEFITAQVEDSKEKALAVLPRDIPFVSDVEDLLEQLRQVADAVSV